MAIGQRDFLKRWLPGYINWRDLRCAAPDLQGPAIHSANDVVHVVSDLHLGASEGDYDAFAAFLAQKTTPRLLILLGDVFHLWFNPPKMWTPCIAKTIQQLEALRKRGTPIWLVIGNHEFFIPRHLHGVSWLPFEKIIHDVAVLHWANQCYVITHGDLANRKDKNYLRFRWFMRSIWGRCFFTFLPSQISLRIGHWLRRTLASKNQKKAITKPVYFSQSEVNAFARVMGKYAQATIIGHFHRETKIAAQGSSAPLYIAPDWLGTRKMLRILADGSIDSVKTHA